MQFAIRIKILENIFTNLPITLEHFVDVALYTIISNASN